MILAAGTPRRGSKTGGEDAPLEKAGHCGERVHCSPEGRVLGESDPDEAAAVYHARMKAFLPALILLACSCPALAQCGFVADPIAVTTWYRSDGWQLPGVSDGKVRGPFKININGKTPAWPDG